MKITPREAGSREVPILAGSMDLGTLELRVIVTGTSVAEMAELKADAQGVMENYADMAADSLEFDHDRLASESYAEVADVIARLLAELA